MKYTEKRQDLFVCPEDYYLAHCISADFDMGRGIVTQFNKRFLLGSKLHNAYPCYLRKWQQKKMKYDCLICERVINLITKERCFQRPTYRTLRGALERMKEECLAHGIQKVAMPLIGCGLDNLKWPQVSAIVKEVFGDTDMEILVCIR